MEFQSASLRAANLALSQLVFTELTVDGWAARQQAQEQLPHAGDGVLAATPAPLTPAAAAAAAGQGAAKLTVTVRDGHGGVATFSSMSI